MNIFAWPAADDGCCWWRLTTPATVLRQLGHQVRVSRFAVPSWIADADTIIGQRVVNPGPTMRWQMWHDQGKRLVFDVDDHLENLPAGTEAHRFFGDPDNRKRMQTNLRLADVVTAGTPALAEWAGRYNDNVVVVPNGLPAGILNWPRPANTRTVIGWAGSLHTLPELAIVAPALRTIVDRSPDVRVHIVGIHPDVTTVRPHLAKLGLIHRHVTFVPWCDPGEAYLHNVAQFDIWVAPYRDIPFNRAKVPTKAIEAACLGIPLIASNVGAYPTTVQHGHTGLLVRRPEHWAGHIQSLIDNPGQRAAMGAAARRTAIHHTAEGHGQLWEKALTP